MRFNNDTAKEQRSGGTKLGMAAIVAFAMFAGLVGLAGAQDGPASDCAGDATTFGSMDSASGEGLPTSLHEGIEVMHSATTLHRRDVRLETITIPRCQ